MAFKSDLLTGKEGEDIVQEFLKGLMGVKEVIDVSDSPTFQAIDVDFVCLEENGEKILVEVKTDTLAHKTGNLAYEVYSSKTYKTQGCFEKTKAKYIFYYLKETQEMYIIRTELLRKFVKDVYSTRRMIPMGDDALGYLIKLEVLEDNKIAFKLQ